MKEALGGTLARRRKERGWRRPRLWWWYVGGPTMTMIVYKFALLMGVNLHFSFDVESHAVDTNIIVVSINTSTKTHGLHAGKTADLTYA
ncbi:hypothetical protein QJS10_CPA10g01650 [Acorus calamus]|uniref:Uncharacterized protein n=1 Tax=Acorus calamus TaxID=4465 RepID=A0AAV9DZU4_ACOCL|nr:hypothetical protein QJS10_CPA10g01650 [Acorus calamus]